MSGETNIWQRIFGRLRNTSTMVTEIPIARDTTTEYSLRDLASIPVATLEPSFIYFDRRTNQLPDGREITMYYGSIDNSQLPQGQIQRMTRILSVEPTPGSLRQAAQITLETNHPVETIVESAI